MLATGGDRPDASDHASLPLAEAEEAYRVFDAREAVKVVLTP